MPPLDLHPLWALTIPGDPVSARRRERGGRVAWSPQYREWKAQALLQVQNRRINPRPRDLELPIACPVALAISIVHPRPSRKPADYPLPWTAARCWRPSVPDWDNLAKGPQDVLVGSGILLDDDRVVLAQVSKCYAAVGESSHVLIEILRVA